MVNARLGEAYFESLKLLERGSSILKDPLIHLLARKRKE